jgi:hypothetical protein
MPLGGDVTQFSIGLMAVLRESIRAGRLPLWNDLWGYGFPGLAESQMGVLYPPHLVLYGLLTTEWAYTVSLVAHTFWAGLGGYWAARRFGITPWGSALAAFAFSTCGFFVVHLPHQWGYTTGSWMPWVWGLTYDLVRGRGSARTPYLLAAALALQILPGHFQLAFETQVGMLLLGLAAGFLSPPQPPLRKGGKGCDSPRQVAVDPSPPCERGAGGVNSGCPGHGAKVPDAPHRWRSFALVLLALAGAFLLAAAQLWPTYHLSRLAASQRNQDYLSDFASPPYHLISYLAPSLFHTSWLWRPLAWDPFHAMPEEHLAYVGLVPLFLAWGAVIHGWRQDARVRILAVVAVVTTLLSFGPYVPGFGLLSRLPGFSFFRAPARWSLAAALALALLAGCGFDSWRSWHKPGRSLMRFVALVVVAPMLVLLVIELALWSTGQPGQPQVAQVFEHGLRSLPWSETPSFRNVMAQARQVGINFEKERFRIYRDELAGTYTLALALAISTLGARRPRVFATALIVLTFVDLGFLDRPRNLIGVFRGIVQGRPTEGLTPGLAPLVGPIRPLTEQSPVLAELAHEPRGTRTVYQRNNLPMTVGLATLIAYRTLDLPILTDLTSLTFALTNQPRAAGLLADVLRVTGAGVRVIGPFENRQAAHRGIALPGGESRKVILDPTLAKWHSSPLMGSDPGPGVSAFSICRKLGPVERAWYIPSNPGRPEASLKMNSDRPEDVLAAFRQAMPLTYRSPVPEQVEIDVETAGPGFVIITQLAHPNWSARWVRPSGEERGAAITPIFNSPGELGWQAVAVPQTRDKRLTLKLTYSGHDVTQGLIVSAMAWLVWLIGLVVSRRPRARLR